MRHDATTPPSPEQERRAHQLQTKIYGTKAALTLETDFLQSGLSTVSIEGAACTAPREYDWAGKVTFQLTRKELPVFTAMMAGHGGVNTMVEFLAHGPDKDKNLRVMDQGASLLVSLRQGQRLLAVRLQLADTYQILAICLKALTDNDPHLDPQAILVLCRRSLVVKPLPQQNSGA